MKILPPVEFKIDRKKEAMALIKKFHYSQRCPANSRFTGTFYNGSEIVAAAVFFTPATRWSEPVLELTRLVRKDEIQISLSMLISLCCKELRKQGYDLLVSYADSSFKHHGGIYQACSWNFHQKRKPSVDGVIIDGVFIPGRSANERWGTRSPKKLSAILKKQVAPHFDTGKYLYWKALSKFGEQKAFRLGLTKKAYPKPNRQ